MTEGVHRELDKTVESIGIDRECPMSKNSVTIPQVVVSAWTKG